MISNFFRLVHNDFPHELFERPQLDIYNRPRPKYYDRVYLCVEDLRPNGEPNLSLPIKGFLCKKFDDFEFADEYFQKFTNKDKLRSTMIPICKWCPSFLDKFLVNYYLKKIFWIGRHSFVRNDGSSRQK